MAPEQKKRGRPVPKNSQRSQKRQKVEEKSAVASDVRRVPVALDALPWNEVAMPAMFEDAEGFYGLEEVEDVEVIKEGGTYQFVCA